MKWLLWSALAIVGAFVAFWAVTPAYKLEAVQLRKACEQMIGSATYRQRECDKIYSDAIANGKRARQ